MSNWYKAEEEDIELDLKMSEVNILVTGDDWGSVYCTLTFKQIRDIADQIGNGE